MKMRMKRTQHADFPAAIVMAVLEVFVVSCASINPSAATNVTRETMCVRLPAGAADVDVYLPGAAAQIDITMSWC